jgi:hypothetical protein
MAVRLHRASGITACDSLKENALAWVETTVDDTLSVMGFSAGLSLL